MKLIPDASRTKKLYMKSADINNFSNYCHMIRNLKSRYGTTSTDNKRRVILTPFDETLTKFSQLETDQAVKDLLQSSKISANNIIGIGASG